MKVGTLNKANEIDGKRVFIEEQLILLKTDTFSLTDIRVVLSEDIYLKIKGYITDILKIHDEKLKDEFENLN